MIVIVRLVLAGGAAAGTLLIGRAAYAREKGIPMPRVLSVAVGAVLVGLDCALAFSH